MMGPSMARLLAVLFLCGSAFAQERAFVEVKAPKDAYYVRELVELKLRFGYDRDFFRTNAVPLFARPMDVPVQVKAELPGGPAPIDRGVPHRGPKFALNNGVVPATSTSEETREGRVFTIVELLYDYAASEPGEVTIAAPTLHYAYATEFDEDFVTGPVAKNPKHEVVSGEPLALRILPVPDEGQPPEFEGAVGHFTVSAEASTKTVEVGRTLGLTFRIRGLGAAMKRRFDLKGFHVYGTVYSGRGATAEVSIAPLSTNVTEIPSIPFAFFDPGPPAGYRVVRTDPIPIHVTGPPAPRPPPPPPVWEVPLRIWPIVVALAVVAAAIAFLLARSRRRVELPDPHRVRVTGALEKLRRTGPGPGLADAFAEFLAAYLRCPPAAVIGPDLPARLAEEGLAPGLATRAAETLERLVAARYGGGLGGAEQLGTLLADLEAAIGSARSPR